MIKFDKRQMEGKLKLALEFIKSTQKKEEGGSYEREQRNSKDS